MPLDDHVVRERLDAVFARQDTFEACKRRDLGALIRILSAHGITQGQVSAMTGIAQSRLSDYKRGKHQATYASTLETIADGLGMPQLLRRAMGLVAEAPTGSSAPAAGLDIQADTFDLQLLAEAIGRNGSGVKRRELLSLAAQLGATAALAQSEVWERLAYALTKPSAMNETIVREMEARSAGLYQLEEVVSARTVLKVLTVHLREVSTLLNGRAIDPKDDLRRRLIVAAGESSLLAGWSASALGDTGTARNFYETAIKAADEARDSSVTACALAYRSYIPSGNGANGRARVLLAEALENASVKASPTTVAWISARHAEESAHLGDASQALDSWKRAEEAFSVADPEEDRVWTRFLNQDRLDTFHIATYLNIGKLDDAQEIATHLLARLTPAEGKRAAVIRENIATAHLARGSVNEAARIAQSGLAIVRETEFEMWLSRFEAIAKGLRRWQNQPAIRAYLEEFAMTKRQFASSPR
ncbi:MAG: helix-turn-helix transcriptional regulator [Streptosporangiaceae bacterium]|nr:helix-turn-helix transcriptional regulator [Streptosporangiaceae bacterium]